MSRSTFIDLCLQGKVLIDEIDDFVARWHEQDFGMDLHEFLGMSWQEYEAWVHDHDYLPYIIIARRSGMPLYEVLQRANGLPGDPQTRRPADIDKVLGWLKEKEKVS
jgi:hypothetical protein